jgi:hypothetical protein
MHHDFALNIYIVLGLCAVLVSLICHHISFFFLYKGHEVRDRICPKFTDVTRQMEEIQNRNQPPT